MPQPAHEVPSPRRNCNFCTCNGTALPQPVRQWHAATPEVPFVASLIREPLWCVEADSEDNLALSVMTELQFAMELIKRGRPPWTFQPIQQDFNQAEDFAVLHAAQIMDVIYPEECMRARKDGLSARRALNLLKRARRPGIHRVERAKKDRRAVAKGGRDARPAERGRQGHN